MPLSQYVNCVCDGNTNFNVDNVNTAGNSKGNVPSYDDMDSAGMLMNADETTAVRENRKIETIDITKFQGGRFDAVKPRILSLYIKDQCREGSASVYICRFLQELP